MAKSTQNQDAFFESLITFMQRHNFDGVDLDWEYPVADDRGGIKADFQNYVTMISRLRQRLNQTGRKYGITLTLVWRLILYRNFMMKIYADESVNSRRPTGTFVDLTLPS